MTERALHFVVGIPGSGKSTYARELQRDAQIDVICSTDELRIMFWKDEREMRATPWIYEVAYLAADAALDYGLIPLVDGTNLDPKKRERFCEIASKHRVRVVAHVLTTPFPLCDERNARRSHPVPDGVMHAMANKMLMRCSPEQLASEGFDVRLVERR